MVSEFSSYWNNLHTWNNCSHVLPNFEYCCLKHSCIPVQSTSIGLKVSYHNPASPVRVKQNLCTFASSGKLCVSIQSVVLNKCSITTSSGLYYISHSVVNLMLSRFSVHRIIIFFSQWQAFAAYRSASSGPVENILPTILMSKIIIFIIFLILWSIDKITSYKYC